MQWLVIKKENFLKCKTQDEKQERVLEKGYFPKRIAPYALKLRYLSVDQFCVSVLIERHIPFLFKLFIIFPNL